MAERRETISDYWGSKPFTSREEAETRCAKVRESLLGKNSKYTKVVVEQVGENEYVVAAYYETDRDEHEI